MGKRSRVSSSAASIAAKALYLAAALGLSGMASAALADSPPCTGSDLATAKVALSDAKTSLGTAISALDGNSADDLDRAAVWLGVRSSNDAQAVKDVLTRALALATNPAFLCDNVTYRTLGDVYAHVKPTDPFMIKLGAFFWLAPRTGFDSQSGTLVHEMTHFRSVGATADLAGTVAESRALAKADPAGARRNANNYEYFVEAVSFKLK